MSRNRRGAKADLRLNFLWAGQRINNVLLVYFATGIGLVGVRLSLNRAETIGEQNRESRTDRNAAIDL